MKRLRPQQAGRWWSPRTFDRRHPHTLRYHELLECDARDDRQAQRQSCGQINQQGPHLACVIATAAKTSGMLSKELASVLSSRPTLRRLVAPASDSPNVSFLNPTAILPARLTFSRGRVVGMIMARSTTRVAATRASRSLHTSSRKDATPASTAPAETSLSGITSVLESGPRASRQKAASLDPESDEEVPVNAEEVQDALSRPPPVNSDYLPLPWKGRLGYACLCTYLRYANPPVFSSRTCRIASILEHRHPLQNPSEPFHATKNRPDRNQPADIARGQAYVEALGLANARDIVKMLRWNDRYGIKFLRLSSEMFPFASHEIYGYKLAPFVSEVLAEAGRVAAELGHRLTMHPGQVRGLFLILLVLY
jgi:UV DNA damage endonuclease